VFHYFFILKKKKTVKNLWTEGFFYPVPMIFDILPFIDSLLRLYCILKSVGKCEDEQLHKPMCNHNLAASWVYSLEDSRNFLSSLSTFRRPVPCSGPNWRQEADDGTRSGTNTTWGSVRWNPKVEFSWWWHREKARCLLDSECLLLET
jgi:hypothetical protein